MSRLWDVIWFFVGVSAAILAIEQVLELIFQPFTSWLSVFIVASFGLFVGLMPTFSEKTRSLSKSVIWLVLYLIGSTVLGLGEGPIVGIGFSVCLLTSAISYLWVRIAHGES